MLDCVYKNKKIVSYILIFKDKKTCLIEITHHAWNVHKNQSKNWTQETAEKLKGPFEMYLLRVFL